MVPIAKPRSAVCVTRVTVCYQPGYGTR
jgi:hypothetical protein